MSAMNIFTHIPSHWGLRGDRELWQELKRRFEHVKDPKNEVEFNKKLEEEFNTILKLGKKTSSDCVWFEHFPQHGMSGGIVSIEWWRKTGIPFLRELYAKSL